MVFELIASRADIDAIENLFNNTALMSATVRNLTETALTLVVFGADVHVRDFEGKTVLHHAAESENMDLFYLFLKKGVNIDVQDFYGDTALIIAARNENVEMAQALLMAGANVNLQNVEGETALMEACMKEKLDLIGLLIIWQANPNLIDNFGISPLMMAPVAVIGMLLSAGADPSLRTLAGETAFSLAYEAGKLDSMEELLKSGKIGIDEQLAAIHFMYDQDKTLLHLSIEKNSKAIIRLCLSYGSNINAQDRRGKTPLMYAARQGLVGEVLSLLALGCEVDLTDYSRHRTALLSACIGNHMKVVSALIQRGASIHISDAKGNTPFSAALNLKEITILNLLLETGRIGLIEQEEALFKMIREDKPEHLNLLLSFREGDLTLSRGGEFLFAAVESNSLGVARWLLNRNRNLIRSVNQEGTTLLEFAGIHNHQEMISLLGQFI